MKNILTKSVGAVLILIMLLSALAGCVNPEIDTPENGDQPLIEELGQDDELVEALIDYLKSDLRRGDIGDSSTYLKIHRIRVGIYQPILVEFNNEDCYFVSAYYDEEHREVGTYCCASDYTWVRYKSADLIKEYYNDEKNVVSFQINTAVFADDILTDENDKITAEHFKIYKPEFVNGINSRSADLFEETFIYLNKVRGEHVYFSTAILGNDLFTIPCINLDGRYYITDALYDIRPSGERYDYQIADDWGEYYNDVIKIMVNDGYNETLSNGLVRYYGLIDIADFSGLILNKE